MKRMYAFSFVFFIIFNFSVHAKRYHGVQKYYFQSIDIQDGKGFVAENAEIDDPDMFWNQNIAPANGKKIVYGEVQKYKNNRDEVLRLCLIQSEEFLIIYFNAVKEGGFVCGMLGLSDRNHVGPLKKYKSWTYQRDSTLSQPSL